jgi:DNA-formamidopyrimidine glycosylase
MPEGPEVRTVADHLRPNLVNRVITSFYKGERAKTIGFHNLQCPATIIGVRSHGKKIIIDLSTGHMMIISLGMAGRVQYTEGDHSHIRFDISDCQINSMFRIMKPVLNLYLNDPRYMGGIDIIPNAGISLYFRDIGPDLMQLALSEQTWMSLEMWLRIFTQNRLLKRSICDVLLEQDLVSGIGNYLRAEILYYAGIHPERIVETITSDEWDRIRICSHKILYLSYSYGGFTIKDFISPDGTRGGYPAAIYGKTRDPSGHPVIKTKIKDRSIHWVPAIQV